MSTQLGELEIDSIEGTTVRGRFTSVYEKNVYRAHPEWGASMLYDAFSSLSGQKRSVAELAPFVAKVHFATPNTASTAFTVEVTDPSVLEGLTTGAWDSYYLG